MLALIGAASGIQHRHHHHHRPHHHSGYLHLYGADNQAQVPCDEECKKKCDEEYELMIRDPSIKNPLENITWNCKNNYQVYTTDYDPHHSWFDKMSGDIMDVNRAMNEIERLEAKDFLADTDTAVLRELKKELGLNPDERATGKMGSLNVRDTLEKAVEKHAEPERSPGYIKAYGLENRMDWSADNYGASVRSVNW